MDWNEQTECHRIMFNACLRRAALCRGGGQLEEALQWCFVAANCAAGKGWFGDLSSQVLEEELLFAARQLPGPVRARQPGGRPRWLHVLSEAYATLGHTNLCRRWIQYDNEAVHSVVLVNQRGPAPQNLVETVKSTDGECLVFDPEIPLLKRAADLRAYAWQSADVIVLHTHADEVLATVAFGVPGGPPVLLLNHADHAYWVGCSVADLVLDIRGSGQTWTRQLRGVPRSALLPIPLFGGSGQAGQQGAELDKKRLARKSLGVPEDMNVLLTVGSEFKYRPLPGMDFLATTRKIVESCDNTCLLAVGPYDSGIWRQMRKATGGRIQAFGKQANTDLFCQAADVYLEGFPAGSLTALLEGGLAGLPCVRAPRKCNPPMTSDGEALDSVPQPADAAEYVEAVIALVKNPKLRIQAGLELQRKIRSAHCGDQWLARLRSIKSQIPQVHSVHPDFVSAGVAADVRNWHLSFLHANRPARDCGAAVAPAFIEAWERTNARPLIDQWLWESLKRSTVSARQPGPARAGMWDRICRWRQNRKIQREGTYAKLFSSATQATRAGKYSSARRLSYRCLLAKFWCVGDQDWLKLLVKLHLNRNLETRFKRMMQTFKSL